MNISLKKKLLFFPILIVAIIISITLVKLKKKPALKQGEEAVSSVKVLQLKRMSIIPQAIGNGHVKPAKSWKAIAEVSGKIVWKDEKLNNGAFFKAGDSLIKIDDVPLKLAISKAEAEVAKSEAKLAEMLTTQKNLQKVLQIRQKMVNFSQKELDRKKELFKKRSIAASDIDKEELSVLNQKNSLQQIISEISLIPEKMKYESAMLKAAKSSLEKAKLDLEYSEIRAPFDCRIGSVSSEVSQFVRVGDILFYADWTGRSEIEAQFDAGQFRVLINPGNLNHKDNMPPSDRLKAMVVFNAGSKEYRWPAVVDRIDSEIDLDTRTVGVVVSVEDTYKIAMKSDKIPLIKGMFCSVILYGNPRKDQLVIPRSSIHGGRVYTIDSDDRLGFADVDVNFFQRELAVVRDGLSENDRIVTTDVVPAIKGMKLSAFANEGFWEMVESEIGFSCIYNNLSDAHGIPGAKTNSTEEASAAKNSSLNGDSK